MRKFLVAVGGLMLALTGAVDVSAAVIVSGTSVTFPDNDADTANNNVPLPITLSEAAADPQDPDRAIVALGSILNVSATVPNNANFPSQTPSNGYWFFLWLNTSAGVPLTVTDGDDYSVSDRVPIVGAANRTFSTTLDTTGLELGGVYTLRLFSNRTNSSNALPVYEVVEFGEDRSTVNAGFDNVATFRIVNAIPEPGVGMALLVTGGLVFTRPSSRLRRHREAFKQPDLHSPTAER